MAELATHSLPDPYPVAGLLGRGVVPVHRMWKAPSADFRYLVGLGLYLPLLWVLLEASTWIVVIALEYVLEYAARVVVETWMSYFNSLALVAKIIVRVARDIRRPYPRSFSLAARSPAIKKKARGRFHILVPSMDCSCRMRTTR